MLSGCTMLRAGLSLCVQKLLVGLLRAIWYFPVCVGNSEHSSLLLK